MRSAGTGSGYILGRVNRLRKGRHRGLAPRQHGGRLLPTRIGEEVTRLDLRQPADQLLQVLLALLHFGEGVLPGLALPADLFQESIAALGELVVLPASVGPEARNNGLIHVQCRSRSRDTQHEPDSALLDKPVPQLLKQLRVRSRLRQHPDAGDHRGSAGGPQSAPQRNPVAGRRPRELGQEKKPACREAVRVY
jgi:hypothetical protein